MLPSRYYSAPLPRDCRCYCRGDGIFATSPSLHIRSNLRVDERHETKAPANSDQRIGACKYDFAGCHLAKLLEIVVQPIIGRRSRKPPDEQLVLRQLDAPLLAVLAVIDTPWA
jgi:hypothetical protein